jgi:hypothetical protein
MMREISGVSGKKRLPPPLARAGKVLFSYPRYLCQAVQCRRGYGRFGDRYPQKILFIAGLPKSGTTWLKKMLTRYPGYHELMLPDAVLFEMTYQGSHHYQLPDSIFPRMKKKLIVLKMHLPGSSHNRLLLEQANIKHIILYRDLRDVAVSYHFYVSNTPWHPEHPIYKRMNIQDGLYYFAETLLSPYEKWIRDWYTNRHPALSKMCTYEQLQRDTRVVMTSIADHFELDCSEQVINSIVDSTSFERMTQGRSRGNEDRTSFFRKGEPGDWENHFTEDLKRVYKNQIGQFLVDFGIEKDLSW